MRATAKHPTFKEDISLARNGEIRMPSGDIQKVGVKKAFQTVDERERNGFYDAPELNPDIQWKNRRPEPKKEPDTEIKEQTKSVTNHRPEPELEIETKTESKEVDEDDAGTFVRRSVSVSRN